MARTSAVMGAATIAALWCASLVPALETQVTSSLEEPCGVLLASVGLAPNCTSGWQAGVHPDGLDAIKAVATAAADPALPWLHLVLVRAALPELRSLWVELLCFLTSLVAIRTFLGGKRPPSAKDAKLQKQLPAAQLRSTPPRATSLASLAAKGRPAAAVLEAWRREKLGGEVPLPGLRAAVQALATAEPEGLVEEVLSYLERPGLSYLARPQWAHGIFLSESMEQLIQQLQDQVATLQQRQQPMEEMVQQLQRQRQEIDRLQAAEREALQQQQQQDVRMDELRAVARGSMKTVIDTKSLGKPKDFDNKEEHWQEFAFKYENWISGIEPQDEIRHLGRQVYVSLAQMLTGESLDVLRNGREDNGLDAWRRLWRRWDPKTVGRNRAAYLKIAQPGTAKTVEQASKMLEQWEAQIRDYESKRKKVVNEELKCAVLTEMMPKEVRLHLQLNARTLTDYTTIRQEVLSFLEARKSHTSDGSVPMDVDALQRKGKDKSGKGKDSKGKGKDTDNSHSKKNVTCWNCGKTGHTSSECWTKPQTDHDKNKARGKGKDNKGKGKDSKGDKGKDGGKGNSQNHFRGYCDKCGKWGHRGQDCRGSKTTNSLETSNQPEPEIGGFDICALDGYGKDETDKDMQPYKEVNSYMVEATVDSGAAVSVMPVSTCQECKVRPSEASRRGVRYRAAGGQMISDLGTRVVNIHAGGRNGGKARVTCSVAEVKKVLLSVAKMVDQGNRVTFGPNEGDSYIENIATGVAIPIRRKNDVYVMDMEIQPPKQHEKSMMLAAVDSAQSLGGRRQAAAPGEPGPGAEDGRVIEMEADEEAAVPARVVKDLEAPTKEEIEQHNIGHIPYRSWCRHCVMGRGRSAAHRMLEAEKSHVIPTVGHDYGFLGRDDNPVMPMLVGKSFRTLWLGAAIVPCKGDASECSVGVMSGQITQMGHSNFIHKTDQESALKALKESAHQALGTAYSVVSEEAPRGSKESNGAMENGAMQIEGLVRTHRGALEILQGIKVEHESALVPWLVLWAAYVYNRFSRDVNGKTPYEKTKGKPFRRELLPFGERIHWLPADKSKKRGDAQGMNKLENKWRTGHFLGVQEGSDEAFVSDENGGVYRARSMKRLPEVMRKSPETILKVKGVPWNRTPEDVPAPQVRVEVGRPDPPPDVPPVIETPPEPAVVRRRTYVTKAMIEKYGFTPGCRGCEALLIHGTTHVSGGGVAHSDFCRARIEAAGQRAPAAPAAAPSPPAVAEGPAGGAAQAPEAAERSPMEVEAQLAPQGSSAGPAQGSQMEDVRGSQKRRASEELQQDEVRQYEVVEETSVPTARMDYLEGGRMLSALGYDVHVSEVCNPERFKEEAEAMGLAFGHAFDLQLQRMFSSLMTFNRKHYSSEDWEAMKQAYAADLGATLVAAIGTDSSAALGMMKRSGLGRVRHIAVPLLWIQDAVRESRIRVFKEKGLENVADAGTKYLSGPKLEAIMERLGYVYQELLETKRELGRLMETVENQNQTITGLQTERADAEAANRQQSTKAFANAIIGDKGKPPTFDNMKKPDFHDWAFKFKAYIGNQSRKCLEGMTQVEYSQNQLNYANYDDEWRQMAQSLFYQLTMYTEGTPLGIIRKVSNQDGFEAYRRLSSQYDPQNMGSILSRLMRVLEFDFGGEAEFLEAMAKFEISIEEYEKLASEALSDNIRSAVLIARAPDALRNHVLLGTPKEEIQWARIKKVAADFLLTKQSMPGGPAPMDIGAINSKGGRGHGRAKGKGKGKGNDTRGKGKDRSSGGGLAGGEKKFQGHCGRCGKWGHEQKDCYAKIHNVSTWDGSAWDGNTWDEKWGSWDATNEKEKGAASSHEDASASISANALQCSEFEGAAWIFAVGALEGPSGTRVGQAVVIMVDTGANKSVCGPSDFPDYPTMQDKRLEIKVANGTSLKHFGDKQVNLKTQNDDEISVIFHVAEVTQPILSVNSINKAGAGVEFPPSDSTGPPSITRDSRSGRSRLGLKRRLGLFFLRATVLSYVGTKIGADGLVVNNTATGVPEEYIAAQVDQPVEQEVRPEATVMTAPRQPTRAEREAHEALHCPYAAWCADCVGGRGLDDRHERIKEAEGVPVIQIDYMFGKTHRDERVRPVMNAIDNVYHSTASAWCEAKGGGYLFLLKCLKRYVEKLGFEKVIIQCDPENAAKDVAAKVARDIGNNATFRYTPTTSKGGQRHGGEAPLVHEGMARTWRRAIGAKYGIVIELRHPLMAWIVRHASWTHDRFLVHRSDYKTSYERQHERHYAKKVPPLGETVMWRQPGPIAAKFESAWGYGIYLGRSSEDDSRICGARHGIVVARSIRRLVESERYDKQLLLATKGIPSDTKAPNASTPVADRPALDLNLPQPARLPRPADAAPEEGQAGPQRAAAESAAAPEVKRAAVEEPESSADKRASDEAPAEGEAHKESSTPTFELLSEVHYDDDDGERLDPDAVREVIKREANFMESLGVGEVAARPRDKKVWGTRCCRRKKGEGVRSRFVVKQFRDAQAGDFFACTPHTEAVRVLMAAALMLKHVVVTTDFSVAFMRTPVKDGTEIYVEMPPEYGMGRGYVWRLKRSLYGLREAALRFQEFLESIVVGIGFKVCKAEPTIYHHTEKGIRVVVHTDDPLASGPTRGVLDEFFDELAKHLAIKGRCVLGETPVIYLGSSLQRFGDVIVEKSKPGYVESILDAAGMLGCRPVGTAGVRPDLAPPGAEQPLNSEEHSLYRRCCGKIQCAIPRRLDVMYPLKELGRRLSEPRAADMKSLKHFLRYLSGAVDLAMVHRSTKDYKRIRGSTDSDWAGCHETRKSTACGIVRWCGVVVSAYARTESVLAQSSPEAEYLAAVELAAEMLYVRELVKFMGFNTSLDFECDASSAIAIASRRGLGRLRHLEVKWLWLQQLVGTGQIKIVKVKGTENLPDVGTKFLGKGALEKCRTMLGLVPIDSLGNGIVAALSASRGARYLATFMVLVNGVRAQPGTPDGGPDPHLAIVVAWSVFCMLVGVMPCWCGWCLCLYLPRSAAGRTGKGCSKGQPSESSERGRSEPEPDPPPAPDAPSDHCRGPSEPRGRGVLLFHLDTVGTSIHSSPNCQALRDRHHPLVTRSGCLICARVLGQGVRMLHHTDSAESAVHADAACRGLRSRRRRLVSRGLPPDGYLPGAGWVPIQRRMGMGMPPDGYLSAPPPQGCRRIGICRVLAGYPYPSSAGWASRRLGSPPPPPLYQAIARRALWLGGIEAAADARLSGIVSNPAALGGRLLLQWRDAVASVAEETFVDWYIPGPRTCLWCCRCIDRRQGGPLDHFRFTLGLSSDDYGVNDYEASMRAIYTMACWDGLDLPNIAGAEQIPRKCQMYEHVYVVDRDPHHAGASAGDGGGHADSMAGEVFRATATCALANLIVLAGLTSSGALEELRVLSDYAGESATVAPLDFDNINGLSLPDAGFKPVPLGALGGDAGREIVERLHDMMLSQSEGRARIQSEGPRKLCADPALRNPKLCIQLLRAHRVPDVMAFASGASFAGLHVDGGEPIAVAEVDLADAFYTTLLLPECLVVFCLRGACAAFDGRLTMVDSSRFEGAKSLFEVEEECEGMKEDEGLSYPKEVGTTGGKEEEARWDPEWAGRFLGEGEFRSGAAGSRRAAEAQRPSVAPAGEAHAGVGQKAVGDKTALDYQIRCHAFLRWAAAARPPVAAIPDLEEALLEYFNQLCFDGHDSLDGAKLASALAHFRLGPMPKLGSLPRVQRALKGWKALAPPRARLPLPWPVVVLVADWVVSSGLVAAAQAIVLTFILYLRPSETLSLRVGSIVRPVKSGPRHLIKYSVLRSETKNYGVSLLLDNPEFGWIDRVLNRLVEGRPADSPVFALDMRSWFGDIEKRGRWGADRGLKRYAEGGRCWRCPVQNLSRWTSAADAKVYLEIFSGSGNWSRALRCGQASRLAPRVLELNVGREPALGDLSRRRGQRAVRGWLRGGLLQGALEGKTPHGALDEDCRVMPAQSLQRLCQCVP
ncbi:unnamed protein product [Prorocentrum cordatum]|uniref:CCHC-type domain-containing protein n=1 Tax=Prorocentrum cordatum TaxID=2364126 RepID=A0ABN9UCY6_9DINO|nr:unnamed protein product [Polarella glacialis]